MISTKCGGITTSPSQGNSQRPCTLSFSSLESRGLNFEAISPTQPTCKLQAAPTEPPRTADRTKYSRSLQRLPPACRRGQRPHWVLLTQTQRFSRSNPGKLEKTKKTQSARDDDVCPSNPGVNTVMLDAAVLLDDTITVRTRATAAKGAVGYHPGPRSRRARGNAPAGSEDGRQTTVSRRNGRRSSRRQR